MVATSPLRRCTHACSLPRRVVFEIGEPGLKAIAVRYMTGDRTGWTYKIKERVGADWTDAVAPAEAVGPIAATRRYRAARG